MAHSYTNLLVHFVCGTKRRIPLISPEIRLRLDEYIGGIARSEHCSLLAAGGRPDHSHWLIRVHASFAPADLMRTVKSRSSSWLKDTFDLPEFRWQNGYGGFSVGQSGADAVRSYIAHQDEHHRTMTFEQEFESMLTKNGIEFDPRYLWIDADKDEDV